jgi:hypothetical protein
MPWCGWWSTTPAFWWLMPLFGLLFMGLMVFLCFRGFGCMPRGRGRSGELGELRREVDGLRDEVRRVLAQHR